jgi:dipeptidyl aminopeptidase/acylaminoacyl peptidase
VGLTFTPDTFSCGVDIVGPSNLVTLIESFPPYWQPFMEVTWYKHVGDPRTEEGKKFLLTRSPITRIDQIRRPLLIGQGANDPRVTRKESDQIVAAMSAHSIPVTYAIYADEGHGFARPENRISFYAIAENFLSGCLGGRAEPIGDDAKGASLAVPDGAANVPGLKDALATLPK